MTIIEIRRSGSEATLQQRWSQVLTIVAAFGLLVLGLNLRAGVLFATIQYNNIEAGIRARYPQDWLIDEGGDYVFRIRDMTRLSYKTSISITLRPIGPDMTERNVLDTLNISRPRTLSRYDVLAIEQATLPLLQTEEIATSMSYTFVDLEINPFLEGIPVVVRGLDILTIRGSQAVIITFRADAATFDRDLAIFNRFLRSLELD